MKQAADYFLQINNYIKMQVPANVSSIQQARLQSQCNIKERVVIKLHLRASFAESFDQFLVRYKFTEIKLRIYPALSIRYVRCQSARFM